jgi:hypothetical protein
MDIGSSAMRNLRYLAADRRVAELTRHGANGKTRSVSRVAHEFGVSEATIWRWLDRACAERDRRNHFVEQARAAWALQEAWKKAPWEAREALLDQLGDSIPPKGWKVSRDG